MSQTFLVREPATFFELYCKKKSKSYRWCWHIGTVLSIAKIKFKFLFIAWTSPPPFFFFPLLVQFIEGGMGKALQINSSFLQDVIVLWTRNTGLSCFFSVVLQFWRKSLVAGFCLKYRLKPYKPGKEFVSTCYRMSSSVFLVWAALGTRLCDAPSALKVFWHQRGFRSPWIFPYQTLDF